MIDALGSIPLFAGVSHADLEPLARAAVARAFPADSIIVCEGDRAETLYLVLSGRVKVFVGSEEGKEVVLNVQGPGTYFGDMMLDDGVRSASVMTLEPCQLAVLSGDAFHRFLLDHPSIALAVIKNLIARTRSMNDRVRDLAVLDANDRLYKLLLSLAHDVNGRLVVEERLTQQEIGERIGASREMVSRVLKHLKTSGRITTEGKRIVIRFNPEAR